ncbi:MAG: C25 family cysteine peptidase, partial [Sphingomonadales bacterium]
LEQYKQFRSSVAGGSYKANLYFIDQLEDQFAFGIKKHPESIRNFIRFARTRFAQPLRSVFLIGKGVLYSIDRSLESNPDLARLSFVPTFGSPASDILLVTEPGSAVQPLVGIGRLSVINAEEIAAYLAKVVQTESVLTNYNVPAVQRQWTKNVVHIVGVGDDVLGSIITSSMNRFASVLKDTFYGGVIHDFSKLSPAPVAQLSATRMYDLFQEGIGMMTYFGHSTANTLEYNLDEPQGYNNQGKYPFYIMLGCRAGNLFNFNTTRLVEKETISEKFVLAEQRGGIATIASTNLGLVSYLDMQNNEMLKAASSSRYGATVGDLINESVVRTLAQTGQGDFLARIHCEQTALNGDPALRFYGSAPRPDFFIEPQQLRVHPSLVSVADGRFSLSVALRNAAKAVAGPVVVQLQRTFPDGTTALVQRDTIRGLYAVDSL